MRITKWNGTLAIIVALLASPLLVKAQSNNRPISAAVTGAVTAVAGQPDQGQIPGLGQAMGQALVAGYTYVATNGAASVGLGNTLDRLGSGKVKTVITESITLPRVIPDNKVVTVDNELVASQLYGSDKTHTGLGVGAYTLWKVGWMKKATRHFAIFNNLEGVGMGASIQPDIDEAVKFRFASRTTVADVKARLTWTF